jgi:hypothetical protein
MPAGAIADQKGMGAGRHLGADLQEVMVHRLGVDDGHDDCRTDAAGRADRAEDVNRAMSVIAHHWRARADRRPDIFDRPLLSDPGFILKPHLDVFAGRRGRQSFLAQVVEVFLKASCAAASFCG